MSYNHTNSFDAIWADNTVPVARQPPGVCTGGTEYSSAWVGIDGYNSNDVFQAGTESDAYCSGAFAQNSTYAWIEWYPYSETQITNFSVNPGDDMLIEVWNTTATQGNAYLVNYRTNQYVTLSLTPPAGYSLTGNSAEWVVELPELAGGLAALPDYVWDVFQNCAAYTFNGAAKWSDPYYPSSSSAPLLTMLDNNNNAISYPTLLGPTAIAFSATGSAF
jgi:Peptidase A4 family